LFIHLFAISVRRMLTRKLHIRGFFPVTTRLMAALFAVQMMVGGFCLMSPELHAMPQAMAAVDIQAHCNGSVAEQAHPVLDHHSGDHHSSNCYHCDQPDLLSVSHAAFSAPLALLLPDTLMQPAALQPYSIKTGLYSTRTPTGPPRSSSLLYNQTQRIRV